MELGNSGLGARRGCWLLAGGWWDRFLGPAPWTLDPGSLGQRSAQSAEGFGSLRV